jgi:spermidine/putrescine transport system ATP-binding protein
MICKPIVEIKNVNKFYGETHVVKNLNMTVQEGEFLSILGPSGCGKTTTLRMIAGFEQQSSGDITVEGNPVEDKEPFDRNVNTVFQSYALFPHMNIYDNVAFGLKMKKVPKSEISDRVNEILAMVQLFGFEKRFPSQLSGGQKQRVAIARAIINRPRVLLLDEPLGALDMKLRKQMQIELKRLQKKLGITFIYVTHDQEEALTMSDRIAVMNGGILEQMAAPSEVYYYPKSKFVADFIGESNLFEGCIGNSENGVYSVNTESGDIIGKGENFSEGELIYVSVRPEKTKCSSTPVQGFSVQGMVKESIFIGTLNKTIIALPDNNEIKVTAISGSTPLTPGSTQYIYWDLDDAVLMRSASHKIFSLIDNVDLSTSSEGC